MSNRKAQEAGRPTLTVDVLIPNSDGDILVIRRGHTPFEGMWCFPGGLVDPGETVENAGVREVEEETSLQVRIARVVGIYSELGRDPRGHYISITLLAERMDDEPEVTEEATDWKWAPANEKFEMAFDHARIRKDFLETGERTHNVVLA